MPFCSSHCPYIEPMVIAVHTCNPVAPESNPVPATVKASCCTCSHGSNVAFVKASMATFSQQILPLGSRTNRTLGLLWQASNLNEEACSPLAAANELVPCTVTSSGHSRRIARSTACMSAECQLAEGIFFDRNAKIKCRQQSGHACFAQAVTRPSAQSLRQRLSLPTQPHWADASDRVQWSVQGAGPGHFWLCKGRGS